MILSFSDEFIKSAERIPDGQRRKLARLLETLKHDPFDPLLHIKKLKGDLTGHSSFRITRDWRVIFRHESPTLIILIDVLHRKDAYR